MDVSLSDGAWEPAAVLLARARPAPDVEETRDPAWVQPVFRLADLRFGRVRSVFPDAPSSPVVYRQTVSLVLVAESWLSNPATQTVTGFRGFGPPVLRAFSQRRAAEAHPQPAGPLRYR